jgi:hypothetical protein
MKFWDFLFLVLMFDTQDVILNAEVPITCNSKTEELSKNV